MSSSVNDVILQELGTLEKERGIKVLYAAEAGSRAWGFPSEDSDYDVRFIYVEPVRALLKLHPSEDNFDVNYYSHPPELDMAGWRLDKALKLMTKSNAALFEWIYSPTKYLDRDAVSLILADLAENYIDEKALVHHYANMASRCVQDHLKTPNVKLKKYFYCIRPILAADYIIAGKGLPPVDFHDLFGSSKIPENIKFKIDRILQLKAISPSEMDRVPQDLELLDWIECSINRLRTTATKILTTSAASWPLSHDHLDQFYYEQVLKYDRVSVLELTQRESPL